METILQVIMNYSHSNLKNIVQKFRPYLFINTDVKILNKMSTKYTFKEKSKKKSWDYSRNANTFNVI